MNIDTSLKYQLLYKEQSTTSFSPGKTADVAAEKASQGDKFTPNGRPFDQADTLSLYKGKQSPAQASLTNGTDTFVSAPKLSAAQASQNILGFVERRLMSEKEQGASEERLNDLMSQAREGVEKGYEQARADLESLGMMNEQLDAEIDESFNLVSQGLDKLAQALFGDEQPKTPVDDAAAPLPADEPATSSPQTVSQAPASQTTGTTTQVQAYERVRSESVVSTRDSSSAASRSAFQASSAYSSSSEFSLRTQDGDVVTISFSSKQAFQFAAAKNVEGMAAQYSSFSANAFSFSVEGDLDEDELNAINDLLAQLSEVSDAFFSGDMATAFESAMSLGFDGTEIAEFSLDLRQSQVEQVKTYSEGPASGYVGEGKFQPFIDQVSRIEQLNQLLDNFEFEKQSLTEMFDRLIQEKGLMEEQMNQSLLENIPKFFERLI